MVASFREQLQELSLYWTFTLGENIVAVITEDRLIDEKLKRKIKTRTLYTQIFQYIGNWSKVFEYLPTLFLQYTFEWREAWVIPRINAFPRNVNTVNLNIFLTYGGVYINMKVCILETSLEGQGW